VPSIDLNSDCGESFGNWTLGRDEDVIPLVTTISIACGFHAGDPVTMLRTIDVAKRSGVRIGAHPGLPDLLGFGRRTMDISPSDTYAYIAYQVGALVSLLAAQDLTLNHVKPHGALDMLRRDRALAEAAADAFFDSMDRPALYWPVAEGNLLANALGARGARIVREFYPDLEYASDGTTVLERHKRAVSADEVKTRVRRLLEDGRVKTVDGSLIEMRAESICAHGDTPDALEVIHAIHEGIERSGWTVGPVDIA